MRKTFLLGIVSTALAAAEPAACVKTAAQMVHNKLGGLTATATDDQKQMILEDINNILAAQNTFAACAAQQAAAAAVEQKRIDKQSGASATASGSTTAVASPSVAQILGISLETGAVTQSISGNSVTFRVNPAKLVSSVLHRGDPWPISDPAYRALDRLSFAFTKDTSTTASGTSNSGTALTEEFQEISDVSVRVNLVDHRNVFSASALKTIRQMSSLGGVSKAAADFRIRFDAILKNSGDSRAALIERVRTNPTVSEADLATMIDAYLDPFMRALAADPEDRLTAATLATQIAAVRTDLSVATDHIAHALVLSLDYDWKRPPKTSAAPATSAEPPAPMPVPAQTTTVTPPNQHTLQLILSDRLILKSEGTLTLGSTFFQGAGPGMHGMWRDSSVGGKWSIPTGDIAGGKTSINFSGLLLYLHQPPLGIDLKINDQKINKPGSIGLFQAQFKIDLGTSGVSIPISFTTSNRTELVKENEVRGNIGVTFDLDKLLAGK